MNGGRPGGGVPLGACAFADQIRAHYDEAGQRYDLSRAGDLSGSIAQLLANGRVFAVPGYAVDASQEATIECTTARFAGTSTLPFPVAGTQLVFGSELVFFLDARNEIQLSLRFEIQATSGLKFSFKDHFPAIAPLFAALQFKWLDYAITSVAGPVDGVDLLPGLNVVSEALLQTRSGGAAPNPYARLAWLWSAGTLGALPYGGPMDPPSDPEQEGPNLAFTSPQTATGLELGTVSITAAAIGDLPINAAAARGIGAAVPLQLGGDLAGLSAVGRFDDPDAANLVLGVEDLPDQPRSSLDAFSGLAGGLSIAAIVPSEFPLSDRISLDVLAMTTSLSVQVVTAFDIGVSLDVGWTLIPQLATLDEVGARFTIINPTAPSALDVSVLLSARTTLTDGEQQGTLLLFGSPPSLRATQRTWRFSGQLVVPPEPEEQLDLFGVVARLFPGVTAPDNPLRIERLDFQLSPTDKTFALDVTVAPGEGWTLPLGITIARVGGSIRRSTNGMVVSLLTQLDWLGSRWQLGLGFDSRGGTGLWSASFALLGPAVPLLELVDEVFASWGIDLPESLRIDLAQLALAVTLNTGAFRFQAGLIWKIPVLPERDLGIAAAIDLRRTVEPATRAAALSGTVRGDFSILGLGFVAIFSFEPKAKQIQFEFEKIVATFAIRPPPGGTEPHRMLTIAFGDRSLGEILADVIGVASPGATTQLTGPWAFLNAINLNGLLIFVDFTDQVYRIEYRLQRGFPLIFIDTVGVEYRKQFGRGVVKLILQGTFFGKDFSGKNALTWDPVTQPPPAFPGAGASSFQLQLLALGQHVTIRDARQMRTIEEVLAALSTNARAVRDPSTNPLAQLPGLEFDLSSGWLIGAQLVLNQVITVGLVFNDPEIYGLLIKAGGPRAGTLKGLRFQILYRKISDDLGLWHVDLTLPKAMRRLQLGQVTVTMPVMTIDVFTNGDFAIDIGFPASPTDYARCFSLEYFPFIGFGGFRFAKLSSATATSVPPITNGAFTPVIEFGIAMAVGLGKTIDVAILSGGIFIVVTGIVEGVYARFEPRDASMDTALYLSLTGTVGIVGKIYAAVDFGIIQASVDLTAYALVTLRIATFEPIFIALEAGVSVSISVKIVFVKIRFSFKATIREQFTIGSYQPTPWIEGDPTAPAGGAAARTSRAPRAARRLRRSWREYRRAQRAFLREARAPAGARHLAGTPVTIQVWATPVVSKALSTDLDTPWGTDDAGDKGWRADRATPPAPEDVVALAMMFFVPTGAPEADTADEIRRSSAPLPDGSIERLMSVTLRWMLDVAGVGERVTRSELEEISCNLQRPAFFAEHFAYAPLTAFIAANLRFAIAPRPAADGAFAGSFFPVIPELSLTAPGYSFDFGADGIIPDGYVEQLDAYFAALKVDFANGVQRDPDGRGERCDAEAAALRAALDEREPGRTLAGYLFTRYFLAVTRGAVGVALDELGLYHLAVSEALTGLPPATTSLRDAGDWFGATEAGYRWRASDTPASVAARLGLPASEVAARVSAPPRPGAPIALGLPITPYAVVEANQNATGILRTWPAVDPPPGAERPTLSGVAYRVRQGDVLGATAGEPGADSIAARFGVPVPELVALNAATPALCAPGAQLHVGALTHAPGAGQTLQTIAGYYEQSAAALIAGDASILLTAGQTLVLPENETIETTAGQTLQDVSGATGVSLDELLALNRAIEVAADQAPISLVDVVHRCTSTDWVLPYLFLEGDTLDGIARRLEPFAAPDELAAFAQLIVEFNPELDFSGSASGGALPLPGAPRPPVPGDVVRVRYRETLEHVAIAFLGTPDVSGLIVDANTTNPALLATGAVLAVPTFAIEVDADTTFAGLSTRYGLSLEELADRLADVPGIFRDPDDRGPVVLAIEDAPAQPVERLLEHLERSHRFTEQAGQLSRFMLQGLRVPAPGDPALAAVRASIDPAGALGPARDALGEVQTFPLYALVGQELPAPADDGGGITLTLTNQGDVDWIAFEPADVPRGGDRGGSGDDLPALPIPLLPEELAQITAYAALELDLSSAVWQALPLANVSPSQQSLANPRIWRAAELPAALRSTAQKAGDPSVWALPPSLVDEVSGGSTPFGLFAVRRTAEGDDAARAIARFSWATAVSVGVQTVAVDRLGPPAPGFYVVAGAGADDQPRLFDLWERLRGGDTASVFVLYEIDPADGDPGYASDAVDRAATTLIQTNLSTQTNPAAPAARRDPGARAIAGAEDGPFWTPLADADAGAIVELLWRSSVTRSGGFYLEYATTDGQALPAWIFDQDGRGAVTFLFVLASQIPAAGGAAAPLYPFNNVALVADPVDTSQETLAAEVALVQLERASTLAGACARCGAPGVDAAALVRFQARVPGLLRAGASVRVRDGGDDDAGLERVRAGDTWAQIAARRGVSLAELARLNLDRDVYRPGAVHPLGEDLIRIEAVAPPGNLGFELTRDAADRFTGDQRSLQELFNLAGFQVAPGADFVASGEGLPVTPADTDDPTRALLGVPTRRAADDGTWRYAKVFRISRLAAAPSPLLAPQLPAPADDPYSGIAGDHLPAATTALAIQDFLGNRTVATGAIGAATVDVGYTDYVIGLDQWPSVSSSYRFEAGAGAPSLVLDVDFSAAAYLPGPGQRFEVARDSVRVDRERAIAIHYQIWAPDVTLTLETSVGTAQGGADAAALDRAALRDLDVALYTFLDQLLRGAAVVAATGGAGATSAATWGGFASAHGTDAGALAEANAQAQQLAALFAAGQLLAWPRFTAAQVDDTLDQLVARVGRPATPAALAALNETVPVQAGTPISVPAFASSLVEPMAVGAVARELHASIASAAGGVVGLVDANPDAELAEGQTLRYAGITLTTVAGDTFASVARRLRTQHDEPSADAEGVAVANPEAAYAPTTLTVQSRVLGDGDDLARVAAALGITVAELAAINAGVPSLYPAGTQLLYAVDGYDPADAPADLTLAALADLLDLSLNELGHWQADKVLAEGRALVVPALLDASALDAGVFRFGGGDAFARALDATAGFDRDAFLARNERLPGLFTPGATIPVGAGAQATLASTFQSLAAALGVTPADVFDAVAAIEGAPRAGAACLTIGLDTRSGDTLGAVADRLGATAAAVADANAATAGLLVAGAGVRITLPDGGSVTGTVGELDSLGKLAARLSDQAAALDPSFLVTPALIGAQNPALPVSGAIRLVPPVARIQPRIALTPERDAALLPIRVTATIARDPSLVQPEFAHERRVQASSMEVGASAFDDPQARDTSDQTLSLRVFAAAFERAFPGFKLATGADRGRGTPAEVLACGQDLGAAPGSDAPPAADPLGVGGAGAGPQVQLWAVRFQVPAEGGPAFTYEADPSQVAFHGLAPLSTQPWASPGPVPVRPYARGEGLGAAEDVNAQAVDLDAVAARFLAAVDGVLSPVAAPRLLAMQRAGGIACFDDFARWKGQLADAISAQVTPVLDGAPIGDPAAAAEAVRQRLLTELSAGYGVGAVVQIPFEVTSPCTRPATAARLVGAPQVRTPVMPAGGDGVPIADMAAALHIDAGYLIEVIRNAPFILQVGVIVRSRLPSLDAPTHEVTSSDTLSTVAAALDLPGPVDLLTDVELLSGDGLLASGSALNITAAVAAPDSAGALVTTLAAALDATLLTLLVANQAQPLFAPGTEITLEDATRIVPGDGTPDDVLGAFPELPTLAELAAALARADLLANTGGPQYTLSTDAVMRVYRVPPVFSFSTTKLALAQTTGAERRFATALLDVQNPAAARFLPVDLDLRFTEIEYDILRDPTRLGDYQESSWLKLVLPETVPAPSTGAVGRLQIPVPLRVFPDRAVVLDQEATISGAEGARSRFQIAAADPSLPRWAYQFTLRRQFASQDVQTLELRFNVPPGAQDRALARARAREALFAALYAFEAVQAELVPDLALLQDPAVEPDEITAAAVRALHTLTASITTLWAAPAVRDTAADELEPYVYDVRLLPSQSDPTVFGTLELTFVRGPSAPLFTVPLTGSELAAGAHLDLARLRGWFGDRERVLSPAALLIDPAHRRDGGDRWLLQDAARGRTYELVPDGDRLAVLERILWPEIAIDPGGAPIWQPLEIFGHVGVLALGDGLPIDRPIVLGYRYGDLDLLNRQNAIGSSAVSRNASLVTGHATNPAFVYDTARAAFPAIVTPALRYPAEIDLNGYAPSSLVDALSGFFAELTAERREADPEATVRIAVVGGYHFELASAGAAAVRTGPLLLRVTDYRFDVSTDWKVEPGSFVTRLAETTEARAAAQGVPPAGGRFTYQLQVFSTLADASRTVPVVTFSSLVFTR